jgi:hypothetical protein
LGSERFSPQGLLLASANCAEIHARTLLLRENLTAQRNLVVRALESQQHAAGKFRAKIVSAQQGNEPRRTTAVKKHKYSSGDSLIQYGGMDSRHSRNRTLINFA